MIETTVSRHKPQGVTKKMCTRVECLNKQVKYSLTGAIYRVSQKECAKLRESVPYVKVYRYNPKHLYPKLNSYGDKSQRKVRASCGSKYCNLHS
jgi:hypothetical protein